MLLQPKRAGRLGFSTHRRRAKFPYVCWVGQGRARSGASFVDHFFPNAFGLEDEFDEFASGAFAAIGFRGVVGGAADFGSGVMDGDGQSDAAHDGEVGQVITEKGDFGFLGTGFAQDVFVGGDFVSLLLIDEFDVEFFAPAPEGRTAPSSDHAGAQTGSDGEREALAVVGVKRLDLKGVVVRCGRQSYAAVGERAVDVHQHDKNRLRAFRESWWDFSSSQGQLTSPLSRFLHKKQIPRFARDDNKPFKQPARVLSVATLAPASTDRADAPRRERLWLHPRPRWK